MSFLLSEERNAKVTVLWAHPVNNLRIEFQFRQETVAIYLQRTQLALRFTPGFTEIVQKLIID